MKRKIIYIIKGVLGLIIVASLSMEWFWYMLAFSDIPVIYTEQMKQDFNIIICIFAITFFALLAEVVIVMKSKIRGSYLVVAAGLLPLILWIARYNDGFNFSDREEIINLYDKRIVSAGVIMSAFSIVTQLLQITLFYRREKAKKR